MSVKVTFYRIKNNAAKIQLICTKTQEAFQHEKRLLISVPNLQAAQYVDTLLWKLPEEGFLPHVIADTATSEWIAITMQDKHNINQASCLLNLCSTPSPLYPHVEEIIEIWDETHPQKMELSQQRFQFYKSKNLLIETI